MNDPMKAALLERAKREKAKRSGSQPTPAPSQPQSPLELMRSSPAGQGQRQSLPDPVNMADPVQGDPTPITAAMEAVEGIDLGTALNNAGEAATFGLVGDEAAAAFDQAIGRGSYDERLEFYRGNQEQLREDSPVMSFASEVAPALLPGLGGVQLVKALTSKLGRAGAGAALGALSGVVYGFAEGEGGAAERSKQAISTGALGGLFGAAAPRAMDALTSVPKRITQAFTRSQERPTIEALKQVKTLAYRAVDESGETFSGDDMTRLYQTVKESFDGGNYVEETDNALRATLKILEKRGGTDTKLGQLDGIRQNLWKRYSNAKDQPQILDAIRAIDNLVDEKAGASEIMGVARAANSRFAKSQLLDDAFRKARDNTATAGSGGNLVNNYRRAVKNIINNEKRSRFFTDDEIDVMRNFVRGDLSENALRLIGKMSPNGNGLMMTLHVVGGMSTSGATLPLMVVGAGAKSAADRGVEKGAQAVQDMVSGFRPAPNARPQITGAQSGVITGATPALETQASGLRGRLPR